MEAHRAARAAASRPRLTAGAVTRAGGRRPRDLRRMGAGLPGSCADGRALSMAQKRLKPFVSND